MRIKYDEKNDAIYIRFSEQPYFESDEIKEGFVLDYDKRGKVVGLEILGVSELSSSNKYNAARGKH